MIQLWMGKARELGKHNVTVNAYASGGVKTGLRIKDDYLRISRDLLAGARAPSCAR